MIAVSNSDQGAAEVTDGMKPPSWMGNYWGPTATRARSSGELPPIRIDARQMEWARWGRKVLQDGDIVFRLGDARALRGLFPLSRFIAKATGSHFSHTGIVALEDGIPVVYDCSSDGVQRQPFEVWMLDCIGAVGVKRVKPIYQGRIPGVLKYCRAKYEQQVPFDNRFYMDDSALYCLELTEKAFRSQGMSLSTPVQIGNWEHITNYPLTALAIPYGSALLLQEGPIKLEQQVYLPGHDHQGVWSSPLLDTVFGPKSKRVPNTTSQEASYLSLRGDLELLLFAAEELSRSYSELPIRWLGQVVRYPRLGDGFLVYYHPHH